MMKKIRNKLLYRWLGINKNLVVLDDEKEFLANAWEEDGFQSFIAFRDLSLLKEFGTGLVWDDYNNYLGRRKELLRFAAEAKKQWEIRDINKKNN